MSAGLAATGSRGEGRAASPPASGGVPARWWASRAAWLVLAAIALAALAVGSIHNSGSAAAARTAQLDTVIKCPACEDLSIAQSDAPSAVALRRRVARFVASGWSDARIESWVTARYGTNALLVPPAGGVNDTLYVVPVAAIGLAVAGLGWHLWQRRRALEAVGGWGEVPPVPDPGDPWHDAGEDGTEPGR
jgi:cytochrome c-type biogenesis protein CcmH